MSIIKIQQSDPCILAGNNLLRSVKFSFAAKGLFLYLLSQPEGWKFSIQTIADEFKANDIEEKLNELITCALVINVSANLKPNDVLQIIKNGR